MEERLILSRNLERQTQESRRRLAELRDQRRAFNFESLSIQRDRDHCAAEMDFLRKSINSEERALDAMLQSNSFLHKSCRDIQVEAEQVEFQRRELERQVREERELVWQEERRNAELADFLERMRREQLAYEEG